MSYLNDYCHTDERMTDTGGWAPITDIRRETCAVNSLKHLNENCLCFQ